MNSDNYNLSLLTVVSNDKVGSHIRGWRMIFKS